MTDQLMIALAAMRDRYPHWRFGQLIANLADWADTSIWDIEDEQLLATANAHLEQLPHPEEAKSPTA